MISGLMSTSKKGDAMTIAEFIEELQEDYDPDVQIESINLNVGIIIFL